MAKLTTEHYKGPDLYSDGVVEDELLALFKAGCDVEATLRSDKRWPVLYHLALERRNLLEWFPFQKGTSLLEIGAGERILLRTDWSHRHGSESWRSDLPRIDVSLAHWLVEREVKLIGVEPPSVADVNHREELTPVHRILLGAGIVIVEGLTNLDQLTRKCFHFIVLPLSIPGCDGAPVRAVAVED